MRLVHTQNQLRSFDGIDGNLGVSEFETTIAAALPSSEARNQGYAVEELPRRRHWLVRGLATTWRISCRVAHWLFGLASLIVILSILASYPLVQFLSLGYLLESSGRIAKTGRIRDAFIGIPVAARMGSIAFGILLSLLPMYLFASLWYSSLLLNGDTGRTRGLRVVAFVLGISAIVHIGWAIFRGGKIRHFFWPAPLRFWKQVRTSGIVTMYDQASTQLWQSCVDMRLMHYFWLGLRGFIGALAWLFIPITLMSLATRVPIPEIGGLMAFAGGLLLSVVLVYLPFMQMKLPLTGSFKSQFDVRTVRQDFLRAPIAYWTALLFVLALAIPLYLLKAELIPREAMWLPALVFVMFMWPARLVAGWAVGRSERREESRIWLSRYLARLGMIPVVLLYSLIVYFTQFTSWYGSLSLYEQHAFLVPVPFFGY